MGRTLLKKWRTAAGLSQAELAEKVGTDQSVISRLETGARGAVPELEIAYAIERVTGGAVPASSWVTRRSRAA